MTTLRVLFVSFFSFLIFDSFSQSLKGIWKGSGRAFISLLNTTSESLEIIDQTDSSLTGIAHYYYTKNRFEHVKFHGTINWKDSIIIIEEDEVINLNIDTPGVKIYLGLINLNISRSGNDVLLSGKWKDKNAGFFNLRSLKVKYHKTIKDFDNGFSSIDNREEFKMVTDIQTLIELRPDEIDSIRFAIYDNGEIDNDTASLYFNDSLIFKSKRLTQIPVEFHISFDKKMRTNIIRLVAENIGSIPPNTAVLIITTKYNKYNVSLSSDYSKNASIEFFLKE